MTDKPPPAPLGDKLPPIRAQAIKEILQVTSQFDWTQAKPIPREAIEDLMVLAYLRGAAYATDRITSDALGLAVDVEAATPSTVTGRKLKRRRNK